MHVVDSRFLNVKGSLLRMRPCRHREQYGKQYKCSFGPEHRFSRNLVGFDFPMMVEFNSSLAIQLPAKTCQSSLVSCTSCIGGAMIAHSRVTCVLTGAGKVTQLLSGILPDKPYTFIGRAFPVICKGLVE